MPSTKYWTGSAWANIKAYRVWNGTSWVQRVAKYWNGSAWIPIIAYGKTNLQGSFILDTYPNNDLPYPGQGLIFVNNLLYIVSQAKIFVSSIPKNMSYLNVTTGSGAPVHDGGSYIYLMQDRWLTRMTPTGTWQPNVDLGTGGQYAQLASDEGVESGGRLYTSQNGIITKRVPGSTSYYWNFTPDPSSSATIQLAYNNGRIAYLGTKLGVVSSLGTGMWSFTLPGVEYNQTKYVEINASGEVYYYSQYTASLRKYSASGSLLWELPYNTTKLFRCMTICGAGFLYIGYDDQSTSPNTRRLEKLTPSGQVVASTSINWLDNVTDVYTNRNAPEGTIYAMGTTTYHYNNGTGNTMNVTGAVQVTQS